MNRLSNLFSFPVLKLILSRCNARASFIVFFSWKKKMLSLCRVMPTCFLCDKRYLYRTRRWRSCKNIVSSEVVIIILQFVYDCMILMVVFLHEEIKGRARAEKPVLRISARLCRCKSTLSTRSTSQGKRRQRKKKNRIVAEKAISRLSNARTRPR